MFLSRKKTMTINSKSLPTRCEVCHQTDCFDPEDNYCSRCDEGELRERFVNESDIKLLKGLRILKRCIRKGLLYFAITAIISFFIYPLFGVEYSLWSFIFHGFVTVVLYLAALLMVVIRWALSSDED